MIAALVMADGALLGVLTGWPINLANTSQPMFMIKLGAAILLLAIAARDK